MNRAIAIAALSAASFVSAADAALTFSAGRATIPGGLDRVTLYALSDVATDQILGADLRVRAAGLVFAAVTPGSDPQTIPVVATNVLTATTTRASSAVFQTIAPGFPTPSNQGPDGDTPPPLAAGTSDFTIVGFDGRAEPARGTNAGSSVNGGLGAAIFSAIVPAGTAVRFTGQAGTEATIAGSFDITNTANINAAPAFSQAVYTTTVDFGNTASPRPFSVPVTATDPDSGANLSISLGALPVGFFGSSVTPSSGGSPLVSTVAGQVSGLVRGTFDIPLTVSDGSLSGSAVLRVTVIPEPATLGALAMGGLLALRRRK